MSTYANVVEIEASRARAMALCSVSVASEIEEMLKKAIARFGKTYVRVNNVPAGWVVKRLVEQTAEEWDRLVDTNLQGVFLCCRYLLPEMLVFSTPPCGIGQMRNGEMKCGDRRNVDDRAALALDHFRCSSRIDPKAPYPLPAGLIPRWTNLFREIALCTSSGCLYSTRRSPTGPRRYLFDGQRPTMKLAIVAERFPD